MWIRNEMSAGQVRGIERMEAAPNPATANIHASLAQLDRASPF